MTCAVEVTEIGIHLRCLPKFPKNKEDEKLSKPGNACLCCSIKSACKEIQIFLMVLVFTLCISSLFITIGPGKGEMLHKNGGVIRGINFVQSSCMEVTISLSFHIINTNDCVIPLMKSFD
jgi:hypothetical protein